MSVDRWCVLTNPRVSLSAKRASRSPPSLAGARYDYEYVRNGTANIFMFVDVNRRWRHAKVTDQRTGADFADCMRELVDEHYPEAECLRVVLDILSSHSAAMLY